MKEIVLQLSRCWAFRSIEHASLKWVHWIFPAIVTALSIFMFFLLPIKPRLFGNSSFTHHIISLVSILPGFFIAALSAVATFNRPTLDETMPDPAPTIPLRSQGKTEKVQLTQRMFLSHLFSYLTCISFFTALIAIGSELMVPSVRYLTDQLFDPWLKSVATYIVKTAYIASIFWLLANLIVTTLYGMYFLTERIHRPHS